MCEVDVYLASYVINTSNAERGHT